MADDKDIQYLSERLGSLEKKFANIVPREVIEKEIRDAETQLELLKSRINEIEQKHVKAETERKHIENKITGVEDNLKWVVRLIMGSVIMTLMAVVLQGKIPL